MWTTLRATNNKGLGPAATPAAKGDRGLFMFPAAGMAGPAGTVTGRAGPAAAQAIFIRGWVETA